MRPPQALAAALAALVLCAAAGCGSDSEEKTVTETVTATGGTGSTDAATSATSATGTTATEPVGGAPLRDSGIKVKQGFTQFRSPSGNIGCVFGGDEVRCDVRRHSWSAPPKPASCDLDYGDSVVLGGGRPPEFLCHGDTALGAGRVLPYGTYVTLGDFRCESRQAGITCINGDNSFFLSRENYELNPPARG